MYKVYYLSTCSSCKRILKDWQVPSHFELQDIKFNPITEEQLENMCDLAGSYESLFSRRARKFRILGLHEQELNEEDYKKYILQDYTFLKRPVLIIEKQIFIGNSKKVTQEAKEQIKAR